MSLDGIIKVYYHLMMLIEKRRTFIISLIEISLSIPTAILASIGIFVYICNLKVIWDPIIKEDSGDIKISIMNFSGSKASDIIKPLEPIYVHCKLTNLKELKHGNFDNCYVKQLTSRYLLLNIYKDIFERNEEVYLINKFNSLKMIKFKLTGNRLIYPLCIRIHKKELADLLRRCNKMYLSTRNHINKIHGLSTGCLVFPFKDKRGCKKFVPIIMGD